MYSRYIFGICNLQIPEGARSNSSNTSNRMLRRYCDAGRCRMALNGAYEHRKTRRLARTLGMDPWAGLGLMEAVWAWVRKAARDGRIEPDQWEDLAEYLSWRRPAEELTKLLVDAKFIDEQNGWWWVHDWDQHADDTTRKSLERSGKGFANGSPSRQWRKGESLKREESSPEVHLNDEEVRVTARARPEPEPEPEPKPEPAAAAKISDASIATHAAAAPPPLSENERVEIAKLLQMAMPAGTKRLYDDLQLLQRVKTAMQGATMAELASAIIRYRKTRKAPDSPGFWPFYLQDVLAPDKRAELGVIKVQPEPKPEPTPPAPSCAQCGGCGVIGATKPVSDPTSVRVALASGARMCDCDQGGFWRDWFEMDQESGRYEEASVPLHQAVAR